MTATLSPSIAVEDDELARTLTAIAEICEAAARGDIEVRLGNIGDDELAVRVRSALNRLLDTTDAFVREASASLEYAARGQFFRRFLVRGMSGTFAAGANIINEATAAMAQTDLQLRTEREARGELAAEFESVVLSLSEQVAAAATEMDATSSTLSGSTDNAVALTASVAEGSRLASDAVTSVASAVEELAATVASIETQAQASSVAGKSAVEEGDVVLRTVHDLAERSRHIDSVVTLINQVASQTRLLALNATIEAARAGEMGKGFSVVASEVKSLAAQTSTATDEIGAQITAIQTTIADVVSRIDGMTGTIREVEDRSTSIANAVREQRAATDEMSKNINDAARGVEEVSHSLGEVEETNRTTSLAARDMHSATVELSELAANLRSEVDRFLRNLN
jgi:methyl-accepting chemotaxis protein